MANRNLTKDELSKATALLERIGNDIAALAGGDAGLLFAYRRKIAKQLTYQERSSPMARRKLKIEKRRNQNGLCERCKKLFQSVMLSLTDSAPPMVTPRKTLA